MYKAFFKRFLDIVVSLCMLPFVLIIIAIFGVLIYLSDRGPVFYNAERLGKKGKTYKMYKLRSMKVNAPDIRNADGSTYNGDNDPRVTKIGSIMRKTSIDEVPQILNVFLGHMSFVGPRPHVTTNYKGYDLLDEDSKRRLDVLPGITGYSQAYFRNSIDAKQKMINDVYYVNHISFMFDLKILIKTAFSVIKRENIYVSQYSVDQNNKEVK